MDEFVSLFDRIEAKVAELKLKYGDDVDLGDEIKADLAALRAKVYGTSEPEPPQAP